MDTKTTEKHKQKQVARGHESSHHTGEQSAHWHVLANRGITACLLMRHGYRFSQMEVYTQVWRLTIEITIQLGVLAESV